MRANIKEVFQRVAWRRLIRRHIWVLFVFLLLSWVFMGNSLTNSQRVVIGAPGGGDHIAGIIWLFTYTDAPYGGTSRVTNFPFGENLAQPQLITSALLLVPTWLLSIIIGPASAWNMMVLAGYLLSAFIMYCFIYWLLRHRGIALFAGVAVGFTPYHYFKSWGHLSYIHSGIFIAILWAFLAFWQKPTRNKGLLLGSLTALLFYSDGYFPLLGFLMVASLGAYAVATNFSALGITKTPLLILRLRYLMAAAAVGFVFLLPIAYVQYKYGGQIQTSLTNSRSNVLDEIHRYGARPADFFLPSEDHPIPFVRSLVREYRSDNKYSNKSEYSLYLGIVPLALAGFAIAASIKSRSSRLQDNSLWLRWVIGACLCVALVASIFSFVPTARLFEVDIPLPSEIIGNLSSFWRVLARLYLVINIAIVTLSAIGLWYVLHHSTNKARHYGIMVVVIILTIIEFMPVNPFARKDQLSLYETHDTYKWLRDQPDIPSLVAYPFRGHPFETSYFGDQLVHQKPLMNSYSSSDKEQFLHRALAGIGDGQTLGTLRSLGINHLLLYQMELSSSLPLTKLYGTYGAQVASINDSVRPLGHALVPATNFDRPIVDPETQVACRKPFDLTSAMVIRRLKEQAGNLVSIQFELKGQPGQNLIIHDDERILINASFSTQNEITPVSLTVPDDKPLIFYHVSERSKDYVAVCNLTVIE